MGINTTNGMLVLTFSDIGYFTIMFIQLLGILKDK